MNILNFTLTNLIMLNLVIAIMGDVYGEVSSASQEYSIKAKADMLYVYATFMAMFRSECDQWGYIYVIRNKQG